MASFKRNESIIIKNKNHVEFDAIIVSHRNNKYSFKLLTDIIAEQEKVGEDVQENQQDSNSNNENEVLLLESQQESNTNNEN